MKNNIKTLKLENLDLHGPDPHGNVFNFKKYFEKVYSSEASSVLIEEAFDLSIVSEFFKRFSFISHSSCSMRYKWVLEENDIDNFFKNSTSKRRPALFFKGEDCIIFLNIVEKNDEESVDPYDDFDYRRSASTFKSENEKNKKNINFKNSKVYVTIHYPSDNVCESMKEKFAFMEKYIIDEKERNCVHVLIKNTYGEYDFEPLDIKMPKIDVSLNYGQSFLPIYDKIVHKLKNNNKGLYMFHGEPGTGKSSFIKYLTKKIDKDFIFIPSSFVDKFISDPDIFSILLRRKKSVIILEDAEKILISRESEDNQHISTLLNISDGILSDILEVSVIVTYNCDDTKIDKALKRKGRTMVDYMFKKLNVDESKKLAEHLNFKKEQIDNIEESMSLSEIYNMSDENRFYNENDLENKKRIIGFGTK